MRKVSLATRLLAKVDATEKHGPRGDCWKWNGATDSWGYGRIAVNGKNRTAHRLSYALFRGPVPSDKLVLHKCDVAHCINPAHLYIGTHADNVNDAYRRNRYPSKDGSQNGRAVLREEDIPEIRKMIRNGIKYQHIASIFKVSTGAIAHVAQGISWKNL